MEEEDEASEGDMDADAAVPWMGVGPFGDRVLWQVSPPPLFQDSGVRSCWAPPSGLPSAGGLAVLELVRAARDRKSVV